MERKARIEKNLGEYKDYLGRLISIRSVIDTDEAPFGSGINRALDEVLNIAEEMGFNTYQDPVNFYGYAEVGEGELFGVLCHVDVVDEGNKADWNFNPYTLTEHDGKLFGRGTIDDKGPTLAVMLALKSLIDEGFELQRKVRFIFGTDEENLWRCLDSYKQKEDLPTMGFAPDADFPLVHVEKGMVQLLIKGKGTGIIGGDSYNAVASHATVALHDGLEAQLKDKRFEVKDDKITVYGTSAHASTPELGDNAIYSLSKALVDLNKGKDLENFVVKLYEEKPLDAFEDDVSGKISFNVGKAMENAVSLDMRYPVTFDEVEVVDKIQTLATSLHLDVERMSGLDSLYVPTDSDLVEKLMESYIEVSGDTLAEPLKIGGATYARSMDNVVAFGPLFPGKPMVAHQANEYIDIEDLKKAIEIYMIAFEKLC